MRTLASQYLKDATSMRQMQLIAIENLEDLQQYDNIVYIDFCDGSELIFDTLNNKAVELDTVQKLSYS